jgi:hypothetical protein
MSNARENQIKLADLITVPSGGTDDTTVFASALTEASVLVAGALGNFIEIPHGVTALASTQNVPNRVRVQGINKRGSILRATAAHAGPYMLTVTNGILSMFDNSLERLTVDANNVAGLGCIRSDAWQEGGGLRDVLVYNFRTHGLLLQNGYGGASLVEIAQCEFFGSATASATSGIKVNQISLTGNFLVKVRDTSITGGDVATPLARGIDIVNDSLHCQNVHFETTTTGIYLDGVGHHVLIGVTGASTVTTLVQIAATFTGSLTMIGCHRGGATNFIVDGRAGGIGTVTGRDIPLLSLAAAPMAPTSATNAKAWAVWNGTTVGTNAPTAGHNVTSVQRTATGSYRLTLTNALSSVDCAAVASCNLATSGTHVRVSNVGTTTVDVFVYVAGVLTDASEVKAIVFGS